MHSLCEKFHGFHSLSASLSSSFSHSRCLSLARISRAFVTRLDTFLCWHSEIGVCGLHLFLRLFYNRTNSSKTMHGLWKRCWLFVYVWFFVALLSSILHCSFPAKLCVERCAFPFFCRTVRHQLHSNHTENKNEREKNKFKASHLGNGNNTDKKLLTLKVNK